MSGRRRAGASERRREPPPPVAGEPRRPDRGPGPAQAETAATYGTLLSGVLGVVGLLLLGLWIAGRGLPYLLGAVDFLVVAGVLAWAVHGRVAQRSASSGAGR